MRKQLALCSSKKSISLDWHEKADYADTSCPKRRCIFLSRFVYLKGPSVDHFMKWSRWAVWHREQGFVQKTYFPKAKKNSSISNRRFFFVKNIGLWQVGIFIGKYLLKILPKLLIKIKLLFKINAYIMCKAWDIHSFNSVSVCSCLKWVFIKFIV